MAAICRVVTRYHTFTVRAGEVLGEADGGVDNSKIEKLLGFGSLYFGIPPGKKVSLHSDRGPLTRAEANSVVCE